MMLFESSLFKKVKEGTKTQTRRTQQRFQTDEVITAQDASTGEKIHIKITNTRKEDLSMISNDDIIKEGFQNRDEFFDAWDTFYDTKGEIVVYEFKVV